MRQPIEYKSEAVFKASSSAYSGAKPFTVISLNDSRAVGKKRRTHIIKRPLDVGHHTPVESGKLPPGRLTVGTDQRDRQAQTTDLPISL